MKINIVGAGIMGLSTAWALERLGHHVTLFDQGPIPNPDASSFDHHRLIRSAYGKATGYMRMVGDAYALWDRLWADLGRSYFVPTGTLCLGTRGQGWLGDTVASFEANHRALSWLDPQTIQKRFPVLNPAGLDAVLFLDEGGVLRAQEILKAIATRLGDRGVDLRPMTRVVDLDPDSATVTLAGGASVGADAVVVAAGPWIGRLVPSLKPRVTPSRQVLMYLDPPSDLSALWQTMPMVLDIDPTDGFYAIPPVAGTGLKVGDHRFTLTGNPDLDRAALESELETVAARCARRLARWQEYRVASRQSCFYTVEAQERLIVEPLGLAGWVMSPCSGHGFKFGPLLGSAVAGALDTGNPGDISLWAAGATE